MSLEHSPARGTDATIRGDAPPESDPTFWHELIDEKVAAAFLGLVDRTMQSLRQRGDGPRYVLISSRCIRYSRIELKAWADARLRSSTADQGGADAAA